MHRQALLNFREFPRNMLKAVPSEFHRWHWLLAFLVLFPLQAAVAEVLPGYSLHFNFIHSQRAAVHSVQMASRAGAQVVSLIPPAHVWEDPGGQRALDAAVRTAQQSGLQIIFSRLDANQQKGTAWAYANVLRRLGRLPDGSPSHDWFRATYGNSALEHWQHDETLYYARHYGRLPNLAGAAIGGMVEPFVSQRGSFVQWSPLTETYEIAQYTPEGLREWHRWLRNRFREVKAVNREYGTRFPGMSRVPMPGSANDPRFGRPRAAYFDLVQSVNDWYLKQYRENRHIWRRYSTAPFLLQLSGFSAEKIARGRPEFAAFDLPAWVDESDGLGVSLYTHAGYEDWGHSSAVTILQLMESAEESGKMTAVMESGCEAPQVTLAAHEVSFATRMGLLMNPIHYVYEYFRYSRDGRVDPGMMVTPAGLPNPPGFEVVHQAMAGLRAFGPTRSVPCFVYLSVPLTARNDALAGRVNRAVYDLAGHVPCRLLPWRAFARIPAETIVLLPPGIDRVVPRSELLAMLDCARSEGWIMASDSATCAVLSRLSNWVSVYPLALERLMTETHVEDESAALLEELSTIPAFQEKISAQPLEPRPGLHWLEHDRQLLIWVDDGEPVVCHPKPVRDNDIQADMGQHEIRTTHGTCGAGQIPGENPPLPALR